jgi:hypothetical protein
MAWDGHERRHAERPSRDAVEARVRELETSIRGLKRDVDALLHPGPEPWQAPDDEKKPER